MTSLIHHYFQPASSFLSDPSLTTRIPSGPGCAFGNVSAFTPTSQLVRKRTKLAWMEMLCHEQILYNRVPKYRRLSLINGDNKSGWQKDIEKSITVYPSYSKVNFLLEKVDFEHKITNKTGLYYAFTIVISMQADRCKVSNARRKVWK